MNVGLTVMMYMGLSFGVVIAGYVVIALLHLPYYLMGGRIRKW